MRKLLLAFALLTSTAYAQVQLGGHIYVPSPTDSSLGSASVVFTSDADCTLATQTNCTATASTGDTASGPYVGTLVVTGTISAPRSIIAPASPGRQYTVKNLTTGGYAISLNTGSGGVTIPNGKSASGFYDGINYNSAGLTTINTVACPVNGSCAIPVQQCYGFSCFSAQQLNAPWTTYIGYNYATNVPASGGYSLLPSLTDGGAEANLTGLVPPQGCIAMEGEEDCYTSYSYPGGFVVPSGQRGVHNTNIAAHTTNERWLGIVTSQASCTTCTVAQVVTNTGQFSIGAPNAGLNPKFYVDGGIGSSYFNGDLFAYGAITSFTSITGARQGYATSTNNYGSYPLTTQGSYWNGTTSQDDTWQWATVMGAGTNPATTYTLTHAGTPGGANVEIPYATKLTPQTYSSLNSPTPCNSTFAGSMASITDASTQTWGATVTGGGTPGTDTLVYCDGNNWTVAGK